jgi:hypothetical protein
MVVDESRRNLVEEAFVSAEFKGSLLVIFELKFGTFSRFHFCKLDFPSQTKTSPGQPPRD